MLCVVVDGKTGDVIGLHKSLGHAEWTAGMEGISNEASKKI